MWSSPDVREHVREQTDFRIGRILTALLFSASTETVGDYEYVYAGKYNALEVPDISADGLMKRLEELLSISKEYTFVPEADFKSPIIANSRYGSVLLYQLVLFLNKIPSNSKFTTDYVKKLYLLDKDQINNFLISNKSKSPRTLKKVSNIDDYRDLLQRIASNSSDPEIALDDWLNTKIPNFDFTDVQTTPLYQKLLEEIGEEKIVELITKLVKYKKKAGA